MEWDVRVTFLSIKPFVNRIYIISPIWMSLKLTETRITVGSNTCLIFNAFVLASCAISIKMFKRTELLFGRIIPVSVLAFLSQGFAKDVIRSITIAVRTGSHVRKWGARGCLDQINLVFLVCYKRNSIIWFLFLVALIIINKFGGIKLATIGSQKSTFLLVESIFERGAFLLGLVA